MIRKSNYSKVEILQQLGREVQAFQDATGEVDDAVAERLRVNRTDLRCLSVLDRGAATASTLAAASGLSRAAITTVLDRLEAAGLARRMSDQTDRRTLRVELTDAATSAIAELYGPLASDGAAFLEKYTREELAVIVRYLQDGAQLQRAHAQRLRQAKTPMGRDAATARARSGRRSRRAPR